jgi:hypothetical protein
VEWEEEEEEERKINGSSLVRFFRNRLTGVRLSRVLWMP